MLCFGLGTAGFVPSVQAYISDQVSYEKRGRVMGTVELAWALTGIVSLPVFGWMIEVIGWRAPFLLLGFLYVIAAGLVWFRLPAVEHRAVHTVSWSQIRQFSLSRPNVLAAMGVSLMLFIAISLFFTIWGIWLSVDFGVNAVGLGLVATGIGVAELAGSGVSILFIDRLGKKRGALSGLLLMAASYLLLSLTEAILWLAVLGLIMIGMLIEFTIVSLIALYSEQVPEARATVFSLTALGASIGLALGSPLATYLWEHAGLWSISVVTASALLIAFGLVHRFLQED
jgi:predicted MFS family arabinose efflux permease